MASETPVDPPAISTFLNEVVWRREEQGRRLQEIYRKLVTTFTLNLALVAIISAAIRLGDSGEGIPVATLYLSYAIGVLFCINLTLTGIAYLPGSWNLAPDLDDLREVSRNYSATVVELWVAEEVVSVIKDNEELLGRLARRTTAAMVSTILTVMLLLGVGAYTMWS